MLDFPLQTRVAEAAEDFICKVQSYIFIKYKL